MAGFAEVLGDPALAFPLGLSLRIMLGTLLVHASLGVALGWALARRGWWGRGALDVLVTLPMVFPPIVLGFGLLLLLGRRGFGTWIEAHLGQGFVFTEAGVLLASVIVGLPMIVKPVQAAIAALPTNLAEAARTLGHGEASIFVCVILPNIAGAVAAGLLMATARALGEVGVTLMLGGNILGRTNTVSLEIYNAVTVGDFHRALVLSAALGLVSVAVLLVLRRKPAPLV
ncbi:molybdate transport system permease protein [Rhodobacter aestuarii]|uniref:Molybdate transport system permease protein n=1 Tax=Rhodobacter aestuarii TaxID=453582 RepID=A0A1N7IYM2_9RHOB|nr:ABC transporter permease subunit [Rhodobacter aestuarii]PTV97390.1 molybdate transport system permease protein [Rhodobacter aestuarii]SIS42107.1 molybdate transport system permease protein [Rhodobacter aestuarii]